MPSGGAGEYDLSLFYLWRKIHNTPVNLQMFQKTHSMGLKQRATNRKRAFYVNLERESEPVMLLFIISGTAGGDVGVFQS